MSVRLMSLVYDAYFGTQEIPTGNGLKLTVSGSTLKAVCLALADHSNDDGKGAYPSLSRLMRKTEFSKPAVIHALTALKQLEVISYVGESEYGTSNYTIHGKRLREMILKDGEEPPEKPREKRRGRKPQVVNAIYPDDGGKCNLPVGVNPIYQGGKCNLPEPSLNHPFNHQVKNMPADAGAPAPEEKLDLFEKTEGQEEGHPASAFEKKGDWVDCMLAFSDGPKSGVDVSYFPEDVQPIIVEVCRLWGLRPPRRVVGKGGEYALWIKDARELQDACGEFSLGLLEQVHEDWAGLSELERWTVGRPGSLTKTARAKAGILRGYEQNPEEWRYRTNKEGDQEYLPLNFLSWQQFDDERETFRSKLREVKHGKDR